MRRGEVLLAAAALAVLAACSGASSARDARTPSTESKPHSSDTSVEPPSIPAQAKRAVLRDYRAFWTALFAASDPPRSDDPTLTQHGTGAALQQAQSTLSGDTVNGIVRRGAQVLDPTVMSVTGATANVRDCYRNNWVAYALTGNVFGAPAGSRLEEPAGPRLRVVTLNQDGGTWKVADIQPGVQEQRTCGSLKDERRVIDAYKRYDATMRAVYSHQPPMPRDPRIAKVVARKKDALRQVQSQVRDAVARRLTVHWYSSAASRDEHAEVIAYTNDAATVQTCILDDGDGIGPDGQVVSPATMTPMARTLELTVEGGVWKVVSETRGASCTLT
jgi:hypothetical protein